MSKQASNTLIGAFVLGALGIAVAGVVVFASGEFFGKVDKVVMFFGGSVKGLNIGAPVVFRGVKIGQVTDIVLEFNARELTALIPVYVDVDPKKIVPIGDHQSYDQRYLKALIEKGLRAQLQLQSLVTGQLMIDIDLHPNTPIRLVGLEEKYPEIPTIPSGMELLKKQVEDLPITEIADKLNGALTGIEKLVNSPELHASAGLLNQLLKDGDVLVKNLNAQVGPVARGINGTTEASRAAFLQAEKTLTFSEGVPGQIASSIKETLSAARDTLNEARKAVENINGIAVQNPNLGYEIGRALEQITELSRSIRVLADYLERHPEALIRGKRPLRGE